jgi:branched-chain amino acid transport system ATP-binding protein
MVRLLEVAGIDVFYGQVAALSQVSLAVGRGEVVALVGANGAGKTTVLRTISGLNRPARGEIRFAGERIDRLSASAIVRRGIAHCPEERKVWPALTVEENLELGGYLRPRRAIAHGLEAIYARFPRLRERRLQLAGTLSGGEQQMLAIGRALMAEPQLLLLDEPSLGLSPVMVDEVAEIIQDIHAKGMTLLLVEQNVRLALTIASRAYVLETGRNVRDDDAATLLQDAGLVRAYLGG